MIDVPTHAITETTHTFTWTRAAKEFTCKFTNEFPAESVCDAAALSVAAPWVIW